VEVIRIHRKLVRGVDADVLEYRPQYSGGDRRVEMVFVDKESWDVQDRFVWVTKAAGEVRETAARSLAGQGDGVMLFNPLNWRRRRSGCTGVAEG